MTIRLVEPRPIDHALSETSSAAPPWSIHTGDIDRTASAALVGDAYDCDPTSAALQDEYRMGWWWGLVCGCVLGTLVAGVAIGVAHKMVLFAQ